MEFFLETIQSPSSSEWIEEDKLAFQLLVKVDTTKQKTKSQLIILVFLEFTWNNG